MDDKRIVELFFERNENAIKETEKKYKRLLTYIAKNILVSDEDSEEIVNDTYLCAWSSIPPNKPNNLSAYLGKITRNLALDKLDKQNASKRGGTSVELIYDELENLISSERVRIRNLALEKENISENDISAFIPLAVIVIAGIIAVMLFFFLRRDDNAETDENKKE